jgi:hypothetical protein
MYEPRRSDADAKRFGRMRQGIELAGTSYGGLTRFIIKDMILIHAG